MKQSVKSIANEIVSILKEQGIYTERDSFQQTKMLLNRYSRFKNQIEINKELIEKIKKTGIEEYNSSAYQERVQGGNKKSKGIPEKEIDKIELIEQENINLEKLITKTELAMRFVEKEPFYEIIVLKFIENKSIEQIAEQLDMIDRTVYRRMDSLIREMRDYIFMNNIINNF